MPLPFRVGVGQNLAKNVPGAPAAPSGPGYALESERLKAYDDSKKITKERRSGFKTDGGGWHANDIDYLREKLVEGDGNYNANGMGEAQKKELLRHASKKASSEAADRLKHEFALWLSGNHRANENPEYNEYKNQAGTMRRVFMRRDDPDAQEGDKIGEEKKGWKHTPWGKSQLTHLPGVREWLREQEIDKAQIEQYLNILAEMGPQTLEQSWDYFRFWVKGMRTSEAQVGPGSAIGEGGRKYTKFERSDINEQPSRRSAGFDLFPDTENQMFPDPRPPTFDEYEGGNVNFMDTPRAQLPDSYGFVPMDSPMRWTTPMSTASTMSAPLPQIADAIGDQYGTMNDLQMRGDDLFTEMEMDVEEDRRNVAQQGVYDEAMTMAERPVASNVASVLASASTIGTADLYMQNAVGPRELERERREVARSGVMDEAFTMTQAIDQFDPDVEAMGVRDEAQELTRENVVQGPLAPDVRNIQVPPETVDDLGIMAGSVRRGRSRRGMGSMMRDPPSNISTHIPSTRSDTDAFIDRATTMNRARQLATQQYIRQGKTESQARMMAARKTLTQAEIAAAAADVQDSSATVDPALTADNSANLRRRPVQSRMTLREEQADSLRSYQQARVRAGQRAGASARDDIVTQRRFQQPPPRGSKRATPGGQRVRQGDGSYAYDTNINPYE